MCQYIYIYMYIYIYLLFIYTYIFWGAIRRKTCFIYRNIKAKARTLMRGRLCLKDFANIFARVFGKVFAKDL